MLLGGSGALVVLLSLIQVSPIKIDPWSWLFGGIGKLFNKEVLKEITGIKTELTEVKNDVTSMKKENEVVHVKDCRARILRFSDELYLGQNHSQEHFKQILGDITTYEKYCDSHPEFENQICVAAIKQVKDNYDERLRNHDFLN